MIPEPSETKEAESGNRASLQRISRQSVLVLFTVLFVVGIAAPLLGLLFPNVFFSNQNQIRSTLEAYGSLAPIVFVLISILPVIITPLNHSVFGIAGGFVFGIWLGFILNWIAKVAGTVISFYIARRFGRRVVCRFVDPETMQEYDRLFGRSKAIWFLIYAIPFLGPDELPYLAGLSSIRPGVFIPLSVLAHVNKSLFLAYLGNGISFEDPVFVAVLFTTLVFGVLFLVLNRKAADS